MKHIRAFLTNQQWKPALLFYPFATGVLLVYQIVFAWFSLQTPETIGTFVSITASTSMVFYLERALAYALLLSLAIVCYGFFWTLRIQRLIETTNHWRKGDFSYRAQENRKDAIGQLSRDLNMMAQELQHTMALQKEVASLNERNLLARELHDTVKQQVFALAFQINIARKMQAAKNDQLDMHLQEAKKILSDIQIELTNLIVPMRKSAQEDQDLTTRLSSFLARWSQQYGILVTYTTEIQGREKNYFLSPQVKGTFFRVAQEALSNVGRHSKGNHVRVTLTIGWLFVILKIVDNGQGMKSAQLKEENVGIASMQERMREIDGQFSLKSKPQVGTEIVATYCSKDPGPDVTMLVTPKRFHFGSLMDEILKMSKKGS